MPQTQGPIVPASPRSVNVSEVDARDLSPVANAIVDICDARLDVVVVRDAFDASTMAGCGEKLDAGGPVFGWSRPNRTMPAEDVQLLGTDTPATPTYRSPRGASLDEYLAGAAAHAGEVTAAFGPGFVVIDQIRSVLRSEERRVGKECRSRWSPYH